MMAAACLLSSNGSEGPNGARVTVDVALPPTDVTTTGTCPVAMSSGAWRLICPGLTYDR
jgi:hypothetical protein